MYERCPACGLKFEREDGYFLGALYIGYGLGIGAIAGLSVLVWEVTKWPIMKSAVWGMILFVPLAPVLTWMARVLWIWMDQAIDPDRSRCFGLLLADSFAPWGAGIKPSNCPHRDLHAWILRLLYNPR